MSGRPQDAISSWSRALSPLRGGLLSAHVLDEFPSHLVLLLRVDEQPTAAVTGDGVLSEEERAEAAQLRAPGHAELHRLSRFALRHMVAAHVGTTPEGVRLVRRPGLRLTVEGERLKLGLAHTEGLVLIGLATDADIGVDVERLDRPVRLHSLMRRACSAEERAWVLEAPDVNRAREERFLHLWVRKEAWLKARGEGLAGGLQRAPGLPPDVAPCDPLVANKIRSVQAEGAWVAWTLCGIEPG